MDEWNHDLWLQQWNVLIPPADRDSFLAKIKKTKQSIKELGQMGPPGGCELALGLVDSLWDLYFPHFGRGKLIRLAAIIKEQFRIGPLMWFSEEAGRRIKEHEQRAFEERQPKRRRSPIVDPLAPTKRFIREYYASEDYESQSDLCQRMAKTNYSMPQGRKFSRDDDDWGRAYLDPKKRGSLCAWLTRQKSDS